MGFLVTEAGSLKRAIWRHVERVRLAEQLLQRKSVEVNRTTLPDAFDAHASAAVGIGQHMQMHVGARPEPNLVSRGETGRPVAVQPDELDRRSLRNRPLAVAAVEVEPRGS